MSAISDELRFLLPYTLSQETTQPALPSPPTEPMASPNSPKLQSFTASVESLESTESTSSRTSAEMLERPILPTVNSSTKQKSNPLPPLSREFPKPEEEVDIATMLARKPGRWTFQGSLAVQRPVQAQDEDKLKEKIRNELAAQKQELFAASQQLTKTMNLQRPREGGL